MEAYVRLLSSTAVLHGRRLHLSPSSRLLSAIPIRKLNRGSLKSLSLHKSCFRSASFPSFPFPFKTHLAFPISPLFLSYIPQESIHSFSSDPNEEFAQWDRVPEGSGAANLGFCGDKSAILTVVLLGWLGAEQKHLKKYADMYNARGIRSVRFVVPMRGLVGFDFGRRVEDKIGRFAQDLAEWCAEKEGDGRERNLIFHTFSNTGWLTYGVILENLQSRVDIIEKIKGCIIDSGPAAEINPQVWAAGFCAAFLKKRSSLTYSSAESFEGSNGLDTKRITPSLLEIIVISILRNFFEIFLMLPNVKQRLSKVISFLSRNQPSCPQLYLYSLADKVIPANLVENFIQEQRTLAINVYAYDFGSSPHVDHFRSYPHLYSNKVYEFIETCGATV
ncbi:uncharacterized protein [Typha latifolia]|uniref:uncharacterized protein n=1 Tax=Typha latifolia TaxID=4733 RepID=UPI003C2B3B5A